VHEVIGHTKPLAGRDFDRIQKRINKYMSKYRAIEGVNVTLKQHVLEDHVVDFTHKWGAGLGLFSEQGGESIHRKINNIERSISEQNPVKGLLSVIKAHHTGVSPIIRRYYQDNKWNAKA
jgi:hypothetical protein